MTPAGTSNELDVQNGWEENTHTHIVGVMVDYTVSGLFLTFFWCSCMAINVNVQYNGGLLHDVILLTQFCLHRGTCLNGSMKRFCICGL